MATASIHQPPLDWGIVRLDRRASASDLRDSSTFALFFRYHLADTPDTTHFDRLADIPEVTKQLLAILSGDVRVVSHMFPMDREAFYVLDGFLTRQDKAVIVDRCWKFHVIVSIVRRVKNHDLVFQPNNGPAAGRLSIGIVTEFDSFTQASRNPGVT